MYACVCVNFSLRVFNDSKFFHIPAEFLYEKPEAYTYLSNGNLAVSGINDANDYEDTLEAMNIMGISEEERTCEGVWQDVEGMWRVCGRMWRGCGRMWRGGL